MVPYYHALSMAFFVGALVVLVLHTLLVLWSPVPTHLLSAMSKNAATHEQAAIETVLGAAPHTQKVASAFGHWETLRSNTSNETFIGHADVKRDPWDTAVRAGDDMADNLKVRPQMRTNAEATWDEFDGPGQMTEKQKDDGESYGWKITKKEADTPAGLTAAFNALHIPTGNKNLERFAEQEIPYKNCNGPQDFPTQGHYTTLMNPSGKSFAALSSYSPNYQLKTVMYNNEPPEGWEKELPIVWRHSDVVWLLWEDACRAAGKHAGDLKYVFRHTIVTTATKRIMERAVGAGLDKLDMKWPGRVFRYADPAFGALLATAHGRLVYNLIMQHKDGLPDKDVESVMVFTTDIQKDEANSYHLLFTLTGEGNAPTGGSKL